jgi:hypothetical protein
MVTGSWIESLKHHNSSDGRHRGEAYQGGMIDVRGVMGCGGLDFKHAVSTYLTRC